MIHLVAGDSALGTLKETSVPGEKLSIDDILMEGPIIDGLKTDEAWIARADYLQRFSIPKEQYLSGRLKRDRILVDSLSHDEIVLWFEFDLHCQANLLYYLDWYASKDLGKTRLTLICPGTFPGRPTFRGLGELRREELESLFPTRGEVTPDQKRVAQRAWRSFSSDDREPSNTSFSRIVLPCHSSCRQCAPISNDFRPQRTGWESLAGKRSRS